MMKKKILTGVIGTALVLGFWTLFDFLYCTLITRSDFTFEIGSNLILPLVVGLVMFFVLIPMYDKDMKKSRANYEPLHEKRHHKAGEERKK